MRNPIPLIASNWRLRTGGAIGAPPNAIDAPSRPVVTFLKDKGTMIMTIAATAQAQLDRLSKIGGEVDTYVAAQVKAATDAMQADHDEEVAALTSQIDALEAKLAPPKTATLDPVTGLPIAG